MHSEGGHSYFPKGEKNTLDLLGRGNNAPGCTVLLPFVTLQLLFGKTLAACNPQDHHFALVR